MHHCPKEYLLQFDPYRDNDGFVSELPDDYAVRMQNTLLPHWPTEVLIEWLHRHHSGADRYTFLGFQNLEFRSEMWPLKAIPNREAFFDPRFCDNFVDIERRARRPQGDWLAKYMLEHGACNTPVILLENLNGEIRFPDGEALKAPYHLLEGHRRLSFLNGLRQIGKALSDHRVWIASWRGTSET